MTAPSDVISHEIRLHAEPGSGFAGTAEISWDLNGDGKPDPDPARPGKLLDQRDVTVTGYDGPITMWVKDPVTHREVEVTRTINLNKPIDLKKYRFAYVASFTQSYLQLIDLDNAVPNPITFEKIVYTLGVPTNPKGT